VTTGIEIKLERFVNYDGHVQHLVRITGGRATLTAPRRPDVPGELVTLTDQDGTVRELVTGEEVTEALRALTDQDGVDVFAIVVRASGDRSFLVPRPHLPVFLVSERSH